MCNGAWFIFLTLYFCYNNIIAPPTLILWVQLVPLHYLVCVSCSNTESSGDWVEPCVWNVNPFATVLDYVGGAHNHWSYSGMYTYSDEFNNDYIVNNRSIRIILLTCFTGLVIYSHNNIIMQTLIFSFLSDWQDILCGFSSSLLSNLLQQCHSKGRLWN